MDFLLLQRPWFTFERHFAGGLPRQVLLDAIEQLLQLVDRQVGGGAATEVDELGFAARHGGAGRVQAAPEA